LSYYKGEKFKVVVVVVVVIMFVVVVTVIHDLTFTHVHISDVC
jgi:hypothetical protein